MVSEGKIERTPCELYSYRYLRGVRLLIAAELVRKHGLPQLKASRIAGIPQPLLNAFLHGRRYPTSVKEVENIDGVRELVHSVADEIIKGVVISACNLCKTVLSLKGLKCPEAVREVSTNCE